MANYSTNEFRSGLRIIIDGNPCIIVENEFVKPGKGQAFNRVRIKNLKTGKTVDTFKVMGPYLVTKDEIADPHNLDMKLWVNGELRQESSTSLQVFKIWDVVSYMSSSGPWSRVTCSPPGRPEVWDTNASHPCI